LRVSSGNPGYSGYEYLIEVNVWVALDLLLVKCVTNEVVIKSRSD
jgi:hypothetical protein